MLCDSNVVTKIVYYVSILKKSKKITCFQFQPFLVNSMSARAVSPPSGLTWNLPSATPPLEEHLILIFLDKNICTRLYIALVCPHIEYAKSLYYLSLKKSKILIENVQNHIPWWARCVAAASGTRSGNLDRRYHRSRHAPLLAVL